MKIIGFGCIFKGWVNDESLDALLRGGMYWITEARGTSLEAEGYLEVGGDVQPHGFRQLDAAHHQSIPCDVPGNTSPSGD